MSYDAIGGFNFRVEIGGITHSDSFIGVSVMEMATSVVEYRNGTDRDPWTFPGRARVGNIILRRAYLQANDLWNWHNNFRQGVLDRRSGTVTILNADRVSIVAQFGFHEAWPSRWQLSSLDANRDALLVEEVELVVRHLELIGA
jgi:phage tail-like protein